MFLLNRIKMMLFWTFPLLLSTPTAFAENPSSEEYIFPQGIQRYVILKPTGEKKEDLPVLEPFTEDTENKKAVEALFENSFMKQDVKLYFLVQNYLINQGIWEKHEPAYLLVSNEQGGFADFGFYLKQGEEVIDKKNVPYIELVKNNAGEENYLGSMTQIYPHEMGHIMYQMLSEVTGTDFPRSGDVHYLSITTDYRTAFHEGFAINFENVSREYESNKQLKQAIFQDIENKKKSLGSYIAGYRHDFQLPLRLEYYRSAMVVWFQNFENLKRYTWVKSGFTKYKNTTIRTKNMENALYYRNSGIHPDTTKIRDFQQALASEGVIATFFWKLINSESKNIYLNRNFYRSFLCDSKNLPAHPVEIFSPLENQYMKIFTVLKKYMNSNSTARPQILDFVDGYVSEFPAEKDEIYSIFRLATGHDVSDDFGPELWIINREHKHGFLVLDQFGGNVAPFYAFNLNTADALDLLTFKNISRDEAQKIMDYRDAKGFLGSLDEIASIPGVSPQTAETLKSSTYDLEYINKFEDELDLNVAKLILLNLAHPFIRGAWVFAIFLIVYYFVFLRALVDEKIITAKRIILKVLKMIFYILIGFICVVFPLNAILLFILVTFIITAIQLLATKNKLKRKDILYTSSVMFILILYSIF